MNDVTPGSMLGGLRCIAVILTVPGRGTDPTGVVQVPVFANLT
jgi:hypothetical protein